MKTLRELDRFLKDNVDFLFSTQDEQIIVSILSFLRPNIKADVSKYLSNNSLDYWYDRNEHSYADEQGFPIAPEELYRILRYTSHSVYGFLEQWERQEKDLLDRKPEVNTFLCDECGRIHDTNQPPTPNMTAITDKRLCTSCFLNMYTVCGKCGIFARGYTMLQGIRTLDGDTVSICQACRDEHIVGCDNCHQWVLKDAMLEIEIEGTLWPACLWCENTIRRKCKECDTEFLMINRIDQALGEGTHCDRCIYHIAGHNSYRYKPNAVHFKTTKSEVQRKDTMFFGLELECELGDRIPKGTFSEVIKKSYTYKDMYIVHDGSLEYGIEVVLMPFSDMWYKHNKRWLIDLYSLMYEKGGRFNRRKVGLHVHTSKAAWTQSQIYKIMRFCYAPEHARVLERLYGRGECEHARKSEYEYQGAVDVAKSGKNVNNEHHYNMINMSTGTTVEFRMFKGTKDINRVFAYLDFIRALHEFTLETGLSYMGMDNFTTFVNRSSKYKSIQPYFIG